MTGGSVFLGVFRGGWGLFIATTLLVISACTTAPTSDSVAKFGSALGSTTSSVQIAYEVAQEVEATENRMVLAAKVACRVRRCEPISSLQDTQPILTAELLDTQYQMLAGLNAYAELLANLTDEKTAILVSESVGKVGVSLKALSSGAKPSGLDGLRIDAVVVDKGASAIGVLGDFLVQERLNAELPEIIEKNHPMIVNIANYLDATIGKPGGGQASKPSGIRGLLQLKQEKISLNSASLIESLRGDKTIDTLQLVDFSGKAYDEAQARVVRVDTALAEVQAAIRKMVSTHAALRVPTSAGTFEQIESFIRFTRRAESAVERALKTP